MLSKLIKPSSLYVLAMHLLIVLILVKSDFIDRVKSEISEGEEITVHYQRMMTYHERIDKNVPTGSYLFIGDSLIQGLSVNAVSENSVNYGIGSDTTIGLLQRLKIYDSINRASAVFILIGVNDFRYRNSHSIIANYERIVDRLPASLKVFAVSILPIDERTGSFVLSNEGILSANSGIKRLTKSRRHVKYCDANSDLVGSDGNLRADFHVGDGVHLSEIGSEVLIGRLRSCLFSSSS